ncbi:methyltransferase [Beauveria brongniartii RCEF 3172]|uniref:Methyltransferase n=1 Tax=Beauveria brongniartii RCEF 3172 TaxID=1081107 RepID=A0A166VNP5_9HYPO|nr:methyltransferase [Beauveria brongniartii RCEF 3172]
MTTHEPSSASVGAMYDKISASLSDVLGGSIHVGYWDDSRTDENLEAATDRLTTLVASRLRLSPGLQILDVGCGTGKPAIQIGKSNDVDITGVAISTGQIESANARLASDMPARKISFQVADAMDLPFADASFDGAYAIESLCHMPDKTNALTQIARVLRPGGRLVIADLFLDAQPSAPDSEFLARLCQFYEVSTFRTADEYRDLLHQVGLNLVEFTDVRHNVKPTYGILGAALRQMAASTSGEIDEKIVGGASMLEKMGNIPVLGYALITAVLKE